MGFIENINADGLPKQIRYDFFLALLGTIIMLYSGYVLINKLPQDPDINLLFFMIIGYGIFLLGLNNLREDFVMEYNLKRLYYEITKFDLLKELEKRKINTKRIFLMKMRYNKVKEETINNKK
ncbi:hypothetical protein HYW74_04090 [Candidatus Pacearchaeota archaeon]|nr:hypothetical protein [Candidatus Pacearchaeota archaeon]